MRVTDTTKASDASDTLRWALPLAAAAGVLILASLSIGKRDLWLDEAFTITSTNQLWTSLVRRSGSMGLYYSFMTPWSRVSLDPAWLRVPSALFAAGAVALTTRLAWDQFGRRVAIWTAVLLVPMLGVIRWAQEARSYTLVMLLGVTSWILLFRAVEKSSNGRWVAWGACGAALVYSHPLAGLMVAAQLVAMRSHPFDRNGLTRRSLVGWATAGVLMLPMAATILQRSGAQPGWVQPLSRDTIAETLAIVTGPWWVPQTVFAAALVVGSVAAVASAPPRSIERWTRQCMVVWLWVAPVVLVLVSFAEPIFVGRYLVPLLPAAAIVLAISVTRLPKPATVAIGVVLALLLVPGQRSLYRSSGDRWTEAAAAIEADLVAGEVHGIAFAVDEVRQPFEVNADGRVVLADTLPVRPAEPWGTNLRYTEPVTDEQFAEQLAGLDLLWEVVQHFGSTYDPGPPDRFEEYGFCLDEVVRVPPRIDLHRFVPCD